MNEPDLSQPDHVDRCGMALVIGFPIGLQWEYSQAGNELLAGERTFALRGCETFTERDEFFPTQALVLCYPPSEGVRRGTVPQLWMGGCNAPDC